MIVKDVCQLIVCFQLVICIKGKILYLFMGEFQQIEDEFQNWVLVSKKIGMVNDRIDRKRVN